jgi:hypothetical protein
MTTKLLTCLKTVRRCEKGNVTLFVQSGTDLAGSAPVQDSGQRFAGWQPSAHFALLFCGGRTEGVKACELLVNNRCARMILWYVRPARSYKFSAT